MLFSSPFISAALMMFSSVTALPQPEDGALMGRASSNPCTEGSYRYNSTTCAFCPAGNACDGKSGRAQPCDSGHYQPNMNSTACLGTLPGQFQDAKGATTFKLCPPGSYQPYATQAFCYGAPRGRFQSLPGQATVCGTCCGWAAPLQNGNVNPVNCTSPTPNAWPSSGDGCISKATSCVRAATCAQLADGTCPAETIRG